MDLSKYTDIGKLGWSESQRIANELGIRTSSLAESRQLIHELAKKQERANMNKEDGGMIHYRQEGGLIDLSGAPQMQQMAPNTPLPPSG